jgi:hypothetical protein
MSGKGAKGSKRKAEDEEVVVDGGEAAAAKPGKKAKTEKAPPKPKVLKMKPLNPDEERVAKGASMERNAAIAQFLDGIREAYKAGVSVCARRAAPLPHAQAHPPYCRHYCCAPLHAPRVPCRQST